MFLVTGRARGALISVLLLGCPKPTVYPDGRGIEGQLEREIIALTERTRQLEAESRQCAEGGKPAPLYAELRQIIVSKEVTVASTGVVTTVTLPETHLFGADGVSIREEAYVTLDLLGSALASHRDLSVVIEGHTSDVAPPLIAKDYADLTDVGYFRATLVADALETKFGVPPEMVTLATRGPYKPIASNDTVAGQTKNARVVVLIYPPGIR